MTGKKIHDILKYWIMERAEEKHDARGNKYYDRIYSGDTEPVDIRVRMKHFDYRPDVVLVRKGMKNIIEIALSEDWRAVVGELALVKACRASNAVFIVYEWGEDVIENIMNVMGEILGFENLSYINLDEDEYSDLEKVKNKVERLLVKWEFF